MESFEVIAEPRESVGKGASRRLRKTGKVPGIVYGTGKDAKMITIDQNAIGHQLENEAFYSSILNLNIGKEKEQVVLKDLQRHPYKRLILHIDFQRIDAKEKLNMRVPLHFINETSCVGVKTGGGVISHIMTDLEISCLPKDLLEYIEVDLAELELNESIHLAELKLPKGVEIYALLHGGDDSQPVASVHTPRVEVEVEEDTDTEEAAADDAVAPDEAKDD
ncbi:MAG: 50S ribosomal protein L25/general stress protein Ctc [Gammaproteobacteria bacterium]|nr:50S ribosomal protein L25/general stress protein Ctc [Gammaproteobacteria bacterium]